MALNDFINKIFGKDDKTAKAVAKDRLRVVLMHDRAAIPAPVMEELRRELMAVLSKYVDIDETASVTLEDYEDAVALVANVPIRRNRLSTPVNRA
ncbi:MAG: cell division topological specificity factor MinE [Cytophagales bacterium]|nr:cell division topological specificity factor MinE [Armatimonadota bacterium]